MVLRFLSDFSRPFNGGGEDFGDGDGDDADEVMMMMMMMKSGTQTATLQLCTSAPKTSATQRSKVAKPSTQASLIFFI